MKSLLFELFLFFVSVNCKKSKTKSYCEENVESTSNSFLWKLKRNPPAYFFGTIHVPYSSVWEHIPHFSKKVFERSDNVVFELDLTNAKTRASLSRCQMLPRGTGLREVIPEDVYQRLKQHLNYVKKAMRRWVTPEQRILGYYGNEMFEAIIGNWERKKPIWVMLMINSITEAKVKLSGTPVLDLHLARLADEMRKNVNAVEEADEQCQPFNDLNISQAVFALNHSLMTQEKLRQGKLQVPFTTEDLIQQYNCGNANSVVFDKDATQIHQMTNRSLPNVEMNTSVAEVDHPMAKEIDAYFKNELIYKRNQRMAERVKNLLKESPDKSFFFAFGAGHFLGNGSIFDFLRQDGLEINNVKRESSSKKDEHRPKSSGDLSNIALLHDENKKKSRRQHYASKRRKRQHGRKKRKQHRRNKQKMSDLWSPVQRNKGKAFLIPSEEYINGNQLYINDYKTHSDIRVVNRYPTVIPPYPYKDWNDDKDFFKDSASSYPLSTYNAYSLKKRGSENLDSDKLELWSSKFSSQSSGNSATYYEERKHFSCVTSTLLFTVITIMCSLFGS